MSSYLTNSSALLNRIQGLSFFPQCVGKMLVYHKVIDSYWFVCESTYHQFGTQPYSQQMEIYSSVSCWKHNYSACWVKNTFISVSRLKQSPGQWPLQYPTKKQMVLHNSFCCHPHLNQMISLLLRMAALKSCQRAITFIMVVALIVMRSVRRHCTVLRMGLWASCTP